MAIFVNFNRSPFFLFRVAQCLVKKPNKIYAGCPLIVSPIPGRLDTLLTHLIRYTRLAGWLDIVAPYIPYKVLKYDDA